MKPACKGKLPILTQVRKGFAYGEQQDYFDAANCIGMPISTASRASS
jgi:alpha-amylase